MDIEHRPTDSVTPYEKNPRKNDAAVDAVANSIREFGFRQPIVVDEEKVIIVGHTRWKAAKKLGLPIIPVHIAKGLTPAQIKAYRIADNATNDKSEWDFALLQAEVGDLQDFDLGQFGLDLFDDPIDPREEWQGMPEYEQEDNFGALATIKVHLANEEDLRKFAALMQQDVTKKTKSIWYPPLEELDLKSMVVDES